MTMQARPITFGQRNYVQQSNPNMRQPQQLQQPQQQQRPPMQLQLPSNGNNLNNGAYPPPAKPLALPGSTKFATPASATQQQQHQQSVPPNPNIQNNALAGPSSAATPSTPAVAATPRPVAHDEQTNITSVEGMVPTLQNIVATVNLDCRLDLKTIALHARNAEYNPKRFAAVIMRIRDPKTTALIFASGKMVVTGAKSEDDSRLASRKYARIIQKLGFDAKFSEFKIQNIVGSCDVKFPIRLEGLAYSHGNFSSYEPEVTDIILPLTLRLTSPSCSPVLSTG